MWDYLSGPFLAAAGLLVVAGAPKLRDPMPLVRALRSVGMPATRLLVRCIAAAEVALGVWALTAPGWMSAALLSAAYLVFTSFVALTLARGGSLGSCGCFGKPDTRPTRTHVALTLATALIALAVTLSPPQNVWSGGAPGETVTTVAFAALIGFLAWQVLAVLPTLSPAAIRGTRRD
jgi:hypothetical protein